MFKPLHSARMKKITMNKGKFHLEDDIEEVVEGEVKNWKWWNDCVFKEVCGKKRCVSWFGRINCPTEHSFGNRFSNSYPLCPAISISKDSAG